MASRARSAFACSVLPARCIFMYLSFAFCFSISSLFERNTPVTSVPGDRQRGGGFWTGKDGRDRGGLPTETGGFKHRVWTGTIQLNKDTDTQRGQMNRPQTAQHRDVFVPASHPRRRTSAEAICPKEASWNLSLWNSSLLNHRIIGWKRLLRSSSPTIHPTPPFLLNHILRCHIYTFLHTSRDGDPTTSLGNKTRKLKLNELNETRRLNFGSHHLLRQKLHHDALDLGNRYLVSRAPPVARLKPSPGWPLVNGFLLRLIFLA